MWLDFARINRKLNNERIRSGEKSDVDPQVGSKWIQPNDDTLSKGEKYDGKLGGLIFLKHTACTEDKPIEQCTEI